jgi:capsular exopolysaccharide synthesis family protein
MGRVEEALRRATDAKLGGSAPQAASDVVVPEEWADDTGHEFDVLRDEMRQPPDDAVHPLRPRDADRGTRLVAAVSDGEQVPTVTAKLAGDTSTLAVPREQYRRLAAALHQMQSIGDLKVILVASALAGEGKTLTASNLALTFSESYERNVLLIDADLRRPSLARTFNIPPEPGLNDALARDFKGTLALRRVSDRLSVLPAGRPTPNPIAGLTSPQMQQIITEARDEFDWVIVDTPPIALMADAKLLSAIADGVVIVVKANATPYHMVKRAIEAIGANHVLGAVLNRSTTVTHGSKYYDYYHYGSAPEAAGKD